MQKNIRNKYKVAAAFSSVTLTLVSLAASTLAWYAIANSLTISTDGYYFHAEDNTEFGLKAPSSIRTELKRTYFLEEDGEWVDDVFYFARKIYKEDLEAFGQFDKSVRFTPISGAHTEDWFNADTDFEVDLPKFTRMPTYEDPTGYVQVTDEDMAKYMYQFEFYVRAKQASSPGLFVYPYSDTVVHANNDQNIIVANEYNSKISDSDANKKISVNDVNKVEDYIRVSFYSYMDYVPTGADKDSYEGMDKITQGAKYVIVDPSPNNNPETYSKNSTPYFGRLDISPNDGYFDYKDDKKEVLYGHYGDNEPVYNSDSFETNNILSNYKNAFIANSRDGVTAVDASATVPMDTEISRSKNANYFENSLATGFLSSDYANENLTNKYYYAYGYYYHRPQDALCYVTHTEAQRLIVSVWAEGWDKDCNSLSEKANFDVNIAIGSRYKDNFAKKGK